MIVALVCVAMPVHAAEPTSAPPGGAPTADEPSIEVLEQQAQQAFADARYDDVVEFAARAYARTGEVRHLYAQAHAERFRGNCRAALVLYARVMAAEPDGVLGQHARDGIKLCERKLEPEPPPPVVTPTETTAVDPLPPTPPPRRAATDVAAGLLLGFGIGSLAAGASFAVVASSHARRLDRADDERALVDAQRRARGFEGAAIAVSVVGTGLVIGAIVRYVQVSRRQRRDASSARR